METDTTESKQGVQEESPKETDIETDFNTVENTETNKEEAKENKSDDDVKLKQDKIVTDDVSPGDETQLITVNPKMIEKLTTGVLGLFLPNLQKARGTLNECLHNQEVLLETVQQENAKFTESTAMQQLISTMQEARVYHNKLVNLKKEMNNLTERSAKIKKRAVRLQQQKQKEDLERAAQKDRETEKERMLAAKVAKDAK